MRPLTVAALLGALLLTVGCTEDADRLPVTVPWHRGALHPDTSPVDLSFLNDHPAGARGFVRVDGDRLVFDDGTPARFWGTNVAAYALFLSSDEQIRTHAQRLARLGFNLVRLHHHDSMRWVTPSIIDATREHTRDLDGRALARLDLWISALADEGIYVWLDMHTGRYFKPGDDVSGQAELAADPERADGRGFIHVNATLRSAIAATGNALLDHDNPLRGKAWRDDPAIVGLLLTNENDLAHFAHELLPEADHPWHTAEHRAQADAFSRTAGLDAEGPVETWPPTELALWLAECEYRSHADLRARLGWPADRPLAVTSYWGHNAFASLPALRAGNVIDAHSYGVAGMLAADPRVAANFASWIAPAQLAGYPTIVSEWNLDEPLAADRFAAPMYVSALAALQGWDALMLYAYSHQALGADDVRASPWVSMTDPAILALMPAAALLFRGEHVRPAQETHWFELDRADVYGTEHASPETATALRTLLEQGRVVLSLPDVPELDWDAAPSPPPDARHVTDLDRDHLPAGATEVVSDTGELRRDWTTSRFTIDTPLTQAAVGTLGGQTVALSAMTATLSVAQGAVVVSSLDGAPLAESGDMLITTVARAIPADGDRLPYLSEPVTGVLILDIARDDLQLSALGPDGAVVSRRSPERTPDGLRIELPAPGGTHWHRLAAASDQN